MTDRERREPEQLSAEERLVGALLRLGGDAPQPPAGLRERVRERARRDWGRIVRRGRRARLAAAAGVALLIAAGTPLLLDRPEPGVAVGRVVLLHGEVEHRGERRRARPDAAGGAAPAISEGDEVRTGDAIATAPGAAIALELAGGYLLRAGESTRLALLAPRTVRLDGGRLYVDSGEPSAGPLSVETPYGRIANLGTQFEAAVDDRGHGRGLTVRVRSGRVRWTGGGAERAAAGGEELRIAPGGEVTRRPTPVFGPDWRWIETVTAAPAIDRWTLERLLAWFCRETGYRVEWSDDDLRRAKEGLRISGSVAGLSPRQALDAVLRLVQLDHRLTADGRLVLSAR